MPDRLRTKPGSVDREVSDCQSCPTDAAPNEAGSRSRVRDDRPSERDKPRPVSVSIFASLTSVRPLPQFEHVAPLTGATKESRTGSMPY